jgi:hypothetical protein
MSRGLAVLLGSLLVSASLAAQQPATAPPKAESVPGVPIPVEGSKSWIGREAEFEAFLKQAHVERVTDVPVGVTKPKRVYVTPGGLAGSFVFKALMPSRSTGFWESYRAEIAAYELDKVLGMGMVPPTVERKVDGVTGSAQLWVEHCTLLRDNDTAKAPDIAAWNRQVYRQRVWDNLTANIDRNQGNLLMDQAWNLILIDHSRAFTASMTMPFPMNKIDKEFYTKLKALDEVTLKERMGKWLFDGPKPILKRRDKIIEHFDQMLAQWGEAGVFVK